MTGCNLLSPGVRAKKKQETVSDFLPGCAAGGRLVFSFESSGQVGPIKEDLKKVYIPTTFLTVFAVLIVNLLLTLALAVLDHQFVFW